MLNTVNIPEGVNDVQVRSALLENYNIEIGGGLGDLSGKVWRVGLMGTSCTRRNVILFLGALYTILKGMGADVKSGALEDQPPAHTQQSADLALAADRTLANRRCLDRLKLLKCMIARLTLVIICWHSYRLVKNLQQ